jgi:predicted DsbA family dithiol-disulfide isomerase
MKKCKQCDKEKNKDCFYKTIKKNDGTQSYDLTCKDCRIINKKQYQKTDKYKEYLKTEKRKEYQKDYQKKNQGTEKYKTTRKAYRKTEKYKEYQKEYYQEHKKALTIK